MNSKPIITFFLSFIILILISTSVNAITSNNNNFEITSSKIYLNFSNNYSSNLTIKTITSSAIEIKINNFTNESKIRNIYGQINNENFCGFGGGFAPIIKNYVNNEFNNEFIMNGNNETIVTFLLTKEYLNCSPGKYSGKIEIQNNNLVSDNLEIYIDVEIPIIVDNIFYNFSGIRNFGGNFYQNNESHSYFFNTSLIDNKYLTINLDSNENIDIFILDKDKNLIYSFFKNLMEKKIVKNITDFYGPYEIRIYGNVSSNYNGTLSLSTLDVIGEEKLIKNDLSPLYSISENIEIKNIGNITQNNLKEYSEIFNINITENLNGNNTFDLYVPDYANKVEVLVEWEKDGNKTYILELFNSNNEIIGKSFDNHLNSNNSNITNFTQIIETNNIINGLWKIYINTPDLNPTNFILKKKIFFNTDNWISTNFTQRSFNENESEIIQINLTLMEALYGNYEGFLGYESFNNSDIIIPIKFNINTGTIILNNKFNSSILLLNDNIGKNFEREVKIPFKNLGNEILNYTIKSNNILKLENRNEYINFSLNSLNGVINPFEEIEIELILNVNTLNTKNEKGIYNSLLEINFTESYPYKLHILEIQLNLTDNILINFTEIIYKDNQNSILDNTIENYVTLNFELKYYNGTTYIEEEYIGIDDFTLKLQHSNITTENINIISSNINNILFNNNLYKINLTIPKNIKGGYYNLELNFENDKILSGNRIYQNQIEKEILKINNSSILLYSNFSSCEYNNPKCDISYDLGLNEKLDVYAFVTNYGLINSNFLISFNENNCNGYRLREKIESNCTSNSFNSPIWNINNLEPQNTCYISWRIESITKSDSCYSNIDTLNNIIFFENDLKLNIKVINFTSSNDILISDSNSISSSLISSNPISNIIKYLEIINLQPIIKINSGNEILSNFTIKNLNNSIIQKVKINILFGNGINISIVPKEYIINPLSSKNINFRIYIDNNLESGIYNGNIIVNSSYQKINSTLKLEVFNDYNNETNIQKSVKILTNKILNLENSTNNLVKNLLNIKFNKFQIIVIIFIPVSTILLFILTPIEKLKEIKYKIYSIFNKKYIRKNKLEFIEYGKFNHKISINEIKYKIFPIKKKICKLHKFKKRKNNLIKYKINFKNILKFHKYKNKK